ncbi:twin-arginine translocase TatA/TatE family subunit [Mariniluteicoccus flavus]
MTPLILGLGVPELLIILAVVLLLFGGTRLAGIGKSSGRAIREFKEETKGLSAEEAKKAPGATGGSTAAGSTEAGAEPRVTEAERRPDDLR